MGQVRQWEHAASEFLLLVAMVRRKDSGLPPNLAKSTKKRGESRDWPPCKDKFEIAFEFASYEQRRVR